MVLARFFCMNGWRHEVVVVARVVPVAVLLAASNARSLSALMWGQKCHVTRDTEHTGIRVHSPQASDQAGSNSFSYEIQV
jgi:hypothetical protein